VIEKALARKLMMKLARLLPVVIAVALLVALAAAPAAAQCSMCRAVIENSTDAAAASKSLDLAALILLVPPVTLFSGLFVAIYRLRNLQGGSRLTDGSEARLSNE
jgi:fructose-specific phosphotransferase system IIC component